jgi:hypothetical protein
MKSAEAIAGRDSADMKIPDWVTLLSQKNYRLKRYYARDVRAIFTVVVNGSSIARMNGLIRHVIVW